MAYDPCSELDNPDEILYDDAFWDFCWDTLAPVLYEQRQSQTLPKAAVCRICGKLFLFPDPRQSCCSSCRQAEDRHQNRERVRNTSRQIARNTHDIEFIGIDGEGVNICDARGKIIAHHYVLLSATGCEPLHKSGEALTTLEIYNWLYHDVFRPRPEASFVGYALGYDFSQWHKDLPQSRAESLFTKAGIAKRQRATKIGRGQSPFPVSWRYDPDNASREWELDHLGDKRIKLRPYDGPYRERGPGLKLAENTNKWMQICDAFAFFQCSFLKAIDPEMRAKAGLSAYLTTEDEYKLILEGKAHREHAAFDEDMIRYNQAEVNVLAALMREVNIGLVENRVFLRRNAFFGPGQIAQASLDHAAYISSPDLSKVKARLPDYIVGLAQRYYEQHSHEYVHFLGENIRKHVPGVFREGARKSYYGGRFELFYHGTFLRPAYEYDIDSAYPRGMSKLPCLFHGDYVSGKGSPYKATRKLPIEKGFGLGDGRSLCIALVTVQGSHPRIGTLPHRTKAGHIIFPYLTTGWYWLHEIEATQRAGGIDKIKMA